MESIEMWTKVTEDNWSFCHYKSLNLKAFICFGADPDEDFFYLVTCTDQNHNEEFFQKKFKTLPEAVENINSLYGKWPLIDLRNKSEGGCSTCEAH